MLVQLRPSVYLKVNVFRKPPFWVVVLERWGDGEYTVAKLVMTQKPELDGYEVKKATVMFVPEDK